MKPTYEELQQQLENTQREFRSADITMQNLDAKCAALAAENAGLNKFIEQSCYVYNGDGSDISDSYTPAHESPLIPIQAQSLLPVASECLAIRDAFIRYLTSENLANKPDANEQQVYEHCAKWVDAMCETPATDALLAEVRNEAGARAVELFAQTLGSPYSVRDEKCYEDGFTRAIEVVRDIQAPRFAYKIRQAGM